jgi:alginate O-acetyltransferase complex protein AlgI
MLFNSIAFLFGFLPVAYLVYWRLKTKTARYLWLAVTGYVFYGFWNPRFCLLMLFSTLVSYCAGVYMLRTGEQWKRKRAMIAAISVDLTLLGFFKYYNFFADTMRPAIGLPHLDIILPVGISFYTFHTISYVVDSYRGTIKPTEDFLEFSCYVSLFSQLVAGPIVRFRQIEADLENIDHSNQFSRMDEGLSYFIIGLMKKVLLADSIAAIIDPGFQQVGRMGTWGSWLLILGYTYQLYFDFSGYSDMAVGLGLLFGIRIPQNFNSPYKALNVSDFWRRWHISLSTCLRDYLYIPLGGSRKGKLRTDVNLMITMLLGGLWHGANWTFVVWGAYHGALLMLHHQFEKLELAVPRLAARAATFLAAVVGWVFFRCSTIGEALRMLSAMFGKASGGLPAFSGPLLGFVAAAAAIAHLSPNTAELKHRHPAALQWGLAGALVACVFRIMANGNTPFLYFQF